MENDSNNVQDPSSLHSQRKTALDGDSSALVLTDFLSNVPPQLTAALVRLGPYISKMRYLVQVISWSSSWFDSWLVLFLWWTVCILVEPGLRYFLPLVFLAGSPVISIIRGRPHQTPGLVTEQILQSTISDLTIIQSLLPSKPTTIHMSPNVVFRVCAISYIPYLLTTHYISLRIILATTGSVLLTWRAPWAVVLRATVWRSAWVRWALYSIWARLSGKPLPPLVISKQVTAATPAPLNSLRFLFTVYENQRWWMGLDWTAALLPSERPSWCTTSLQPISPPNAFALPDNTTVYLSDGRNHRVKRSATWRWEEQEWRVVIRKEGGGLSRVERPLPVTKEESTNRGSKLLKAAGKLRDSGSFANSGSGNEKNGSGNMNRTQTFEESDDTAEEEVNTDADGWVYGDNKWEARSSRGGMGKYTRFRRWSRVAVVNEMVEVVDDGETGIHRDSVASLDSPTNSPVDTTPTPSTISSDSQLDSPLRQRLKRALTKSQAQQG